MKNNRETSSKESLSYPQFVLRRLARLREEAGLSQKDVGRVLGISQQAYSNCERGVPETGTFL